MIVAAYNTSITTANLVRAAGVPAITTQTNQLVTMLKNEAESRKIQSTGKKASVHTAETSGNNAKGRKDETLARVNGQKEKAKERRELKSPTKMLHAIIAVKKGISRQIVQLKELRRDLWRAPDMVPVISRIRAKGRRKKLIPPLLKLSKKPGLPW